MNKLTEKEIDSLKKLFEEDRIDVLIGYMESSLPFQTTPCFIRKAGGLDKLVTGPFLTINLVHYLNEVSGKTAIVVKRCDIPSVISLIQEGRFTRDQVVLIEMVCPGALDLEKILAKTGLKAKNLLSVEVKQQQVILETSQGNRLEDLNDLLTDKCLSCDPSVMGKMAADITIGDPKTARQFTAQPNPVSAKIAELEALTGEERWVFWKKELSRCIRCYACKNSCPVCYCTRCMVEINNPRWVSPANTWQDNIIYQMMRLNHVAGRCIDCGECSRACPVGIPLNLLTGHLFKTIIERFNHVPGEDPEAKPPLLCYHQDDPDEESQTIDCRVY